MSQLIPLRSQDSARSATRRNVLLLSPSYARDRNTQYFPIGLSYLASYIRQFGHRIVPLNMNNYGSDERYAALADLLEHELVDVIGLGGLTVAFNELDRLITFIRARSERPIVLGGGITSCESELVMRALRPDYMVVGEGELIFRRLLDALGNDAEIERVKGIWHWSEGEPAFTGEGEVVNRLDDLPEPDLELFGMQGYLDILSEHQFSYHETRINVGRSIPITASRSCPFRCTFCYHAGMGTYRRHSIRLVVDHIERCRNRFDTSYFMIYDELFSASKKRIHEFCDLLEERRLDITWYCQLRVDQLDQALLHRMREAGCIHISYGFESGSDEVLHSMKKKVTAEQIARAVEMTRRARIGIQANFLFGDPRETHQTLRDTLDFQQRNQMYFVDWSAVIPYPGTALYEHAEAKGLIRDRVQFMRDLCNISGFLWKSQVNMTGLSDQEYWKTYVRLRELNDENHRKRPAQIVAGRAAGRLRSQLELECPWCERRERILLPYPPDASHGKVNLGSAVGVLGLNIVCAECNRKVHLAANRIPHVAPIYQRFQQALDELARQGRKVVLLPAMDRYFGTFSQDVDLSGLRVEAVLDWREARVGQRFLYGQVARLDEEAVRAHADCVFVVLPWVEHEDALQLLVESGIRDEAVICWNRFFEEHVEQAQGEPPIPSRALTPCIAVGE
ncbi:MAG: B12-binding domain-containing radical SAM protein [Proteobacteria bacterium]|nr:B12-binding domain-containing radical SAM protein [Pseudomonadota bacterium]